MTQRGRRRGPMAMAELFARIDRRRGSPGCWAPRIGLLGSCDGGTGVRMAGGSTTASNCSKFRELTGGGPVRFRSLQLPGPCAET